MQDWVKVGMVGGLLYQICVAALLQHYQFMDFDTMDSKITKDSKVTSSKVTSFQLYNITRYHITSLQLYNFSTTSTVRIIMLDTN